MAMAGRNRAPQILRLATGLVCKVQCFHKVISYDTEKDNCIINLPQPCRRSKFNFPTVLECRQSLSEFGFRNMSKNRFREIS